MALSEEELLLLDCFMYSDIAPNCKDKTEMREIIREYIDINTGVVSEELLIANGVQCSGKLSYSMLADIMNEMLMHENINRLVLTHTTREYEGSIRAACFYDAAEDRAVVAFRGTGGSYQQWRNNFEGYGDFITKTQKDAMDFVNSLPYEHIDSTGHSNGGGQAMYVAIVCPDKIDRCVAFEGQGFSSEFAEIYKDEIASNAYKIKNICADNDPVNALMFSIAKDTVYVKSDSVLLGGLFCHGSYGIWSANKALLDENGNFSEASFVNQTWYCSKLHDFTKIMAVSSNIPIKGSYLELVADIMGICAGVSVSGKWIYAIQDIQKSMAEFAVNMTGDMFTVVFGVSEALSYIGSSLKNGLGIESDSVYASDTQMIKVDTFKLRDYAQRLYNVNNRIMKVDSRLSALYSSVGINELKNLIQADVLTRYSWKLVRCAGCLNDTATEFENAEDMILGAL